MSTTFVITRNQVSVVEANLCLLLSKAFSLPREFENDYPSQLEEIAPEFPEAICEKAQHLADEWAKAVQDKEAATLAYSRLFLGPFEILASPYASTYLEPDGRLMAGTSQQVADEYAEAGLAPGEGPSDAPDHIALEWEYLYYLGFKSIETGDSKWALLYHSFVSGHMASWTPQLAAMIKSSIDHPFYLALADLVEAYVLQKHLPLGKENS
jgi:TorA maturation chaperone TorD